MGGRKDTPSGHITQLWCAKAVASGSCADGNSGVAGLYGCGARVVHTGALSDGCNNGHHTSEDHDGGQNGANGYGDKSGAAGGGGDDRGIVDIDA